MKLLEKKSSNHRLGQGEINRSKKFHWYRKNSHSIREKKEKELHQLAGRGSFANSTRTRNKITELLNKTGGQREREEAGQREKHGFIELH